MSSPQVKIYVLPDGTMPRRMSEGAIGYDVYLRAIVSPYEKDPKNEHLRKTLFDFKDIGHCRVQRFVEMRPEEEGKRPKPAFRLDAGQMALCGIGFMTEMEFPLCYLTLPRSGLASKHHIIIGNAPGTVDPDYRGEAGIILYNCGMNPFYLYKDMRIAQILFTYAVIPEFKRIANHTRLKSTNRGAGGFGSTGLRG